MVTWQPGRNDAVLERILPGATLRPAAHGPALTWIPRPDCVLLLPGGAQFAVAGDGPLAWRRGSWENRWHRLPGLPVTVWDRFADVAAACPDAPAVIWAGRAVSYRQAAAAARKIAARIAVPPGSVVAVTAPRGPAQVIHALGVLAAGCAYAMLDPALPAARREAMAAAAGAAAVIGPDGDVTVSARGRPASPALAYVAFTSGSAGTPKAVGVGHAQVLALHRAWRRAYHLPRISVHAQIAPASFDVWCGDVFRALLSGAALAIAPDGAAMDPPALHALLEGTGAQFAELVPATALPLARWLRRHRRDLAWMRLLAVGSDRWAIAEWDEVRASLGGPQLVNSYGTTETCIDTTWWRGEGPLLPPSSPVPVGQPLPGLAARVVDGNLAGLPDGETGQLAVGGPGVSAGYLSDPDLTAARFVPDPERPGRRLYLTGDLAHSGPHGLTVTGRADEQVKIGGVRIEPGEVEAVLAACPGVSRAAVAVTGGRLAAWVAGTAPPGRVRAWAAGRLLPQAVPVITAVGELPLTAAGKTDRAALAARGLPRRSALPVPDDPAAAVVYRAWAEVLGEPPGEGTWADHGGTSLLAAGLADLISTRLGIPLSPWAVTGAVSFADLAGLVTAGGTGPAEPADGLVLVTGGTGAVGRAVAAALAATRRQVAVTGRPGSAHRAGLARFIEADLADTARLGDLAGRAGAVVHAAWDWQHPGRNVAATAALARGRGDGPLVFISTTDVHAPGSAYAQAKADCEQIIEAAGRGRPWTVLRPPHVWGPDPRLASQLRHGDLAWLTGPLLAGQPVAVPGGGGDGWIDVRDLAAAVTAALARPASGPVDVVTGRFTWPALARSLARLARSPSPVRTTRAERHFPAAPGGLARLGVTPAHRRYPATLRDTLAAGGLP